MKKITGLLIVAALFIAFSAFAAPYNVDNNNPQVVAYYPEGPHGIVGELEHHEGADLVMKTGDNGNFQQWFYGTSESDGTHGDHSLWKISKDGTCPEGSTLVPDPNPAWGDYLTDGVNYCVRTNDFHSNN